MRVDTRPLFCIYIVVYTRMFTNDSIKIFKLIICDALHGQTLPIYSIPINFRYGNSFFPVFVVCRQRIVAFKDKDIANHKFYTILAVIYYHAMIFFISNTNRRADEAVR